MSDSLTCSQSQPSTLQAGLHTCEPRGTSCEQMADLQAKGFAQQNTFCLRSAAVTRRHSADGTAGSGSGSSPGPGQVNSDCFHRYRPHFSCLQEGFSPDTCSQSSSDEAPLPWDLYNGSIQSSYPKLPAGPVVPSYFLSHPSYSSSSPLQQVSSRLYSNNDQSKYSLQSLSTQPQQEGTTQPLFPKPIYSYSILIFMALKSSKTGSLPVSEIYSFMTEHFPYFKTAPDGWKNSVRHNLSLNKCFEKVENKNGNSSRKGCLWALNPAKVAKMQEELHKWRRKDPITVRRSMARPEDLDRLVGERPGKLRSLAPYTSPALLSRVTPFYGTASSPCSPSQLRPPGQPARRSPYADVLPQQPCCLPRAAAQPSNSFAPFSPCEQQPAAPRGLNSPMAERMPPVYNSLLQAEYGAGPRSVQDMLLEVDTGYDIDTFNPSLTDLQLQGSVWEELREDTLVSDNTTTLSAALALQDPHNHASCLQVSPAGATAAGRCKAEYEDENTEQRGCLNGLHPVTYSGLENLAGYLTSSPTSISLL